MKIFKVLAASILVFSACNSGNKKDLIDGLYANVETNKGEILLELYAEDTPLTVSNFVALAEGNHPKVADSLKGINFYDGVKFHRVIPNFMIQTGDRTGTGSGNNGYRFADEFPLDSVGGLKYKHDAPGVLSMANSGVASNSSQFFITHKDTPWLNNKHTVFGKVLEGQNIVDSIAQNDTIVRVEILRYGKLAKNFDAPKEFEIQLIEAEKRELVRLEQEEAAKKVFLEKMGIADAKATNSGLKILSLQKGRGRKVNRTRKITISYTLHTAAGKLIQSTEGKDPYIFSMDKRPSIKGFEEGLSTMRKGDKKRLFIPYTLGYGIKGAGPIPPKSDLVFDIEVLEVAK